MVRSDQLNGKKGIVTGGARGIGKAIAEKFASAGASVFILDNDGDEAEKVSAALRSEGLEADFVRCDVSSQSSVVDAVKQVLDRAGRVDILINNAGIAHIGTATSTCEQDLDRIYSVNIKGVYNCLHAILPGMQKQKSGSILNLASVAATVALPQRFAYSMSKAAVLNMTMTVAKDYVDDNIRCNSISPGRVHTPFVDGYLKENYPGQEQEIFEKLSKTQPIGRMGKPEEIAALALFLASDEAGFITGTDYPIDGGFIKLNS